MNVQILHEVGAPSHVRALQFLINHHDSEMPSSLHFFEYSLTHKKDKFFVNVFNLFKLAFFSKDKIVVLGMAPFDYRMIVIKFVLKNHRVFLHTSWPCWDGKYFPKKRFAHSQIVQNSWKTFLEKNVKGILSVNSAGKRSLDFFYGVGDRTTVVGHSYDPSIYHPALQVEEITEEPLKLLFVGRFVSKKGIRMLFKLAMALPKDLIRISFVGSGYLDTEINDFCCRYDHCSLIGRIDDEETLAKLYREHDILLLPSQKTDGWEELFGLVIIEAMACGLVPITTDHVGPVDIIKNRNDGYYFTEEEYFQKCAKLLRELHEDRKTLELVKSRAIQSARRYSSIEVAKLWKAVLFSELLTPLS